MGRFSANHRYVVLNAASVLHPEHCSLRDPRRWLLLVSYEYLHSGIVHALTR